ncbi:ATP-dependent RNA helicase DbpA [Dokdonella sp.]|uniref:ATP-dependent RNA helicase DbpA n=1 Tax=Dokdonella sp. TaxID=2291710 RepID=UPI0031BFEC9A|nr:ATP-dependent RNA helicase DbpA [Dokdonella sp.]
MENFSALALDPALGQSLESLGYSTMTPVQAQSLPAVLAGRDLIAQAPTGSGKTVAFALGLLQRLDAGLVRPQALVLCPTRELADQVAKVIRRLASGIPNVKVLLLTGGVALAPQMASLRKDSHVIVGTPGRVQEMLRRKVLHLAHVRTLVLDEADRMLDMGFEEPIREIVGRTPATRQTLLFSATWPEAIRAIGRDLLRDPLEVTVAPAMAQASVEQRFFEVELADKPALLAAILHEYQPESSVVFCNTRRDVDAVAAALGTAGISALALHGDIDQRDRDEVLVRFANRSCRVLVASDVAARGLDIQELAAVINYELPPDPDIYLHRIGRTARAGQSGLALSLVTPREMPRALALETRQGAPLAWTRASPAAGGPARSLPAAMVTLRLDAGRTDKMRPGDILGALTGEAGLPAEAVGRIDVFPTRCYVAIRRADANRALQRLQAGRIKGRNVRVARL